MRRRGCGGFDISNINCWIFLYDTFSSCVSGNKSRYFGRYSLDNLQLCLWRQSQVPKTWSFPKPNQVVFMPRSNQTITTVLIWHKIWNVDMKKVILIYPWVFWNTVTNISSAAFTVWSQVRVCTTHTHTHTRSRQLKEMWTDWYEKVC